MYLAKTTRLKLELKYYKLFCNIVKQCNDNVNLFCRKQTQIQIKKKKFTQKHIRISNTKRLYQRQYISRKLKRQPRPLMKNYPSRKKEPRMVYKLGKDGAFDLTLGYLLAPATDTTQQALVIIIIIILA